MKPQFGHELMTSFMLWFDNYLLRKGEAFENKTGVFHYIEDDRVPSGFLSFSSEFKQFVNDSSLTGLGLSITPNIISSPGFDLEITGVNGSQSGHLLNDYNGTYRRTSLTGTEATGAGGTKIGNFFNYTGGHGTSGSGVFISYNPLGNPYWRITKSDVAGEGSDTISNVNQDINTAFNNVNFGDMYVGDFAFIHNRTGVPGTGVVVDYENGRLLVTGNDDQLGYYSTGSTLTGSFTVKDFNVYLTDQGEEDLIIENKFMLNSRYGTYGSGIEPYDPVVPAVFINTEYTRNEPFAFGGEDKTHSIIKAVVMAENAYQLDGIMSIFRDSKYSTFNKIPFSGHPSTEYGGLKTSNPRPSHISNNIPHYDYDTLSAEQSDTFYIDDVTVSKFSERAQKSFPGEIKVGFLEFDVFALRFPRA